MQDKKKEYDKQQEKMDRAGTSFVDSIRAELEGTEQKQQWFVYLPQGAAPDELSENLGWYLWFPTGGSTNQYCKDLDILW